MLLRKNRVKICWDGGGTGSLTDPSSGNAVGKRLKLLVPVLKVFFDEVARASLYMSQTNVVRVDSPVRRPNLLKAAWTPYKRSFVYFSSKMVGDQQ